MLMAPGKIEGCKLVELESQADETPNDRTFDAIIAARRKREDCTKRKMGECSEKCPVAQMARRDIEDCDGED